MAEYNNSFSLSQMVTNTKSHKTSATGVVGVLFCLVGLLLFVGSIICYFLSIGESSLLMSLLDKILLYYQQIIINQQDKIKHLLHQ